MCDYFCFIYCKHLETSNHWVAGKSQLRKEYLYCTHQPVVNLFLPLTTKIMRHLEPLVCNVFHSTPESITLLIYQKKLLKRLVLFFKDS